MFLGYAQFWTEHIPYIPFDMQYIAIAFCNHGNGQSPIDGGPGKMIRSEVGEYTALAMAK